MRWLTPKQTAEKLLCSRQHVYDLIRQGLLKGWKECRRIRIDAESLDQYLRRHQAKGSVGGTQGRRKSDKVEPLRYEFF